MHLSWEGCAEFLPRWSSAQLRDFFSDLQTGGLCGTQGVGCTSGEDRKMHLYHRLDGQFPDSQQQELDPLKSWTPQHQVKEGTGSNLRRVLRALLTDIDIFKRELKPCLCEVKSSLNTPFFEAGCYNAGNVTHKRALCECKHLTGQI